jgi:deoxycytidine triphosphate deaminase
MLLNRDEIQDRNLIIDGFDRSALRAVGYDLRVKTMIIKSDGGTETFTDDCDLPGQGVVAVVSEEVVKLPADVCAFASVKTTLCREGIVAINIGLIDPGWEGPISSVLLNFGKDMYRLRKGETFLRLTFHLLTPPKDFVAPPPLNRQQYEPDITAKFTKRLARKYMDVDSMAAEISKKNVAELRSVAIKYVPLMALGLAFITFFLNFSVLAAVSRFMPYDAIQMIRAQTASDAAKKEVEEVESENRDLRNQIANIRAQVQSLLNQSAGRSPVPAGRAGSK